ncbi:Protein of unknown function [Formosa sp. Hel1_31_208]|uniref:DUF2752 domain-containing protein n=1 Tax=Formosa sp. Hel1_31_208 TaxID=1798225 RepID=UPI00087D6A87|nr:DUF2752 domain-containing protein [Formosa sp. Hel1_31_208]SDS27067.1 Protein of unknown function [Formosa sp. Hel1_31_208]
MYFTMMSPEDYMFTCLNKKLFGFECFGCGGQRALVHLFHGEFIEAFKMYPAIYPLIMLFGYISLNIFFKFKNGSKIISILAITSIVFILTNYIIKLIS